MSRPDLQDVERALAQARALGILGPGEVADHLEHALGFAEVAGFEPPGCFLDLGSGGGVPGLVLAALWPSSTGVLLDSSRRRTSLLADAVARLGLAGRIEVLHARAEVAAHDRRWREKFPIVTARSFGSPALTAECGLAFVEPGGRLVVAEPPFVDPTRWPSEAAAALGSEVAWGRGGGRLFAILRRTGPLRPSTPRTWRAMARDPAW